MRAKDLIEQVYLARVLDSQGPWCCTLHIYRISLQQSTSFFVEDEDREHSRQAKLRCR